MKKLNAIVLPIHLKKINWLILFLSSIDKNILDDINFDIILVVSNEDEQIRITRSLKSTMLDYMKIIRFLDCDKYIGECLKNQVVLERYRANTDRCIVNLKKFVGLHWAKDYYKYISSIDCDSLFRNKESVLEYNNRIAQNYHQNMYFGSEDKLDAIQKTLETCSYYFDDMDRKKLQEITNNFTVYPWFFDVPSYLDDDLKDFFELMESKKDISFWQTQNWHTFEHIIFIYYRCLYKDSNLINYTHELRACRTEFLTNRDLISLKLKYGYMPVWTRLSNTFDVTIELLEGENVSMFYHTDRI